MAITAGLVEKPVLYTDSPHLKANANKTRFDKRPFRSLGLMIGMTWMLRSSQTGPITAKSRLKTNLASPSLKKARSAGPIGARPFMNAEGTLLSDPLQMSNGVTVTAMPASGASCISNNNADARPQPKTSRKSPSPSQQSAKIAPHRRTAQTPRQNST